MFSTLPRRIAAAAAVAAAVTLLTVPASADDAPAPGGPASQSHAPASASPTAAPQPAAAHPAATPATWTVTLTPSATVLWPTHPLTLTATASIDVAGTGSDIMIYEKTGAKRQLALCASGTTCTVSVTNAAPGAVDYEAEIATTATGSYPPLGIAAASAGVSVTWYAAPVELTAHPSTVAPGQPVTLTATRQYPEEPGPTPFFLEIWDATAGTPVLICPDDTCTETVTQADATTHRYVAYTTPYSAKFPPANIQSMSSSTWVTWSATGWTASAALDFLSAAPVSATATVNRDVGPTPYWIELYLEQDNADGTGVTGTRLAVCGTGTTCTVPRSALTAEGTLVAFVSNNTTSFPPTGIQAVTSRHYRLTGWQPPY